MNRPFNHKVTASPSLHGRPPSDDIAKPVEARAGILPANTGMAVTAHKMPCLSCDGEGTVEVLDLDATRPHCAICDDCDGTGLVEPYCTVCEEKLTVDGFCYSCDEYGEGFAPAGWDSHNFTAGVVIVDRDGRARVEM
jgi:RecJ-like exonuclease